MVILRVKVWQSVMAVQLHPDLAAFSVGILEVHIKGCRGSAGHQRHQLDAGFIGAHIGAALLLVWAGRRAAVGIHIVA